MAHGLSVAQVAAVINVAFLLAKFSYPLLVSLIAIRSLKPKPNAATWSVFGRLINESLWPTFLNTDSASTRKVEKKITALANASTVVGVVLAVAVAITPLGLHEITTLRQDNSTVFVYARDESPVSQATRSRESYVTSRKCGFLVGGSCPGNFDGYSITGSNRSAIAGVAQQDSVSTAIAANITEAFTTATGSSRSTLASVFDIQWRSYLNHNNATKPTNNRIWYDEGRPLTTNLFRFSENFATEEGVRLVDGLIVSTITNGSIGIGFRNHTKPTGSLDRIGFRWTEDILWLSPETHCTDLNISLDVSIPEGNRPATSRQAMRLRDRGGLFDRPENYRILDLNDTQDDAKLQDRSWKAAVFTNRLVKRLLREDQNEDHRQNPKEYPLDSYAIDAYSSDQHELREISLSRFGEFNRCLGPQPNLPFPMTMLNLANPANASWANSSLLGIHIDSTVQGTVSAFTNISSAGTVGVLLLGPARVVDTSSAAGQLAALDSAPEPGSNWTQPLYACVSAVKASIKSVQLSTNGTNTNANLKHIEVASISNTATSVTWGVEDSGRRAAYVQPLWGIVNADANEDYNVYTLQRAHLYLSLGSESVFASDFLQPDGDADAGAKAPFHALGTIYLGVRFADSFPTLTGRANWPLAQKWAELSQNASTASDIINLLWIEFMANAVVGTKSVLSRPDVSDLKSVNMPAEYYVREIAYHWVYAVTALIFAAIYLGTLVLSLALALPKRMSFEDIRFMLNQSSADRIMTTERFKDDGGRSRDKTKQWADRYGDEVVQLPLSTKTDASKQGQHLLSPANTA